VTSNWIKGGLDWNTSKGVLILEDSGVDGSDQVIFLVLSRSRGSGCTKISGGGGGGSHFAIQHSGRSIADNTVSPARTALSLTVRPEGQIGKHSFISKATLQRGHEMVW